MNQFIKITGIVFMLSLFGCSSFDVLNIANNSDKQLNSRNLAYGDKARQTLDIYQAQNQQSSKTIIFFYGGNWRTGSKEDYAFIGASLARRDINVVVVDYRLYPEVTYPDFVNDGTLAVDWVVEYTEKKWAKQQCYFLMGHSAGAHIAAKIAYQKPFRSTLPISGFIGLSGPYLNFLPTGNKDLSEIFGFESEQQVRALVNKQDFVSTGAPPALLIHGGDDDIVLPRETHAFESLLQERSVPVSKKIYTGKGHASIAASVATLLKWTANTQNDLVDFVNSTGCLVERE